MHRMRATPPRDSFFTAIDVGDLSIGKGTPLASHSKARVVAAAMSWGVAMLWDRM